MRFPIKVAGLDAPNPWQVAPRIYTCGQVTQADVHYFANVAGVTAVLNLLPPTQELSDEDGWWADAGIDYDVIPIIWMQPTVDGICACTEWLTKHKDDCVLVHCSMNYRVSSLVHVIRRLRGTVRSVIDDAWLLSIWDPNPIWLAHIELLSTSQESRLRESAILLDAFDF
ncbi:MAG: hypothetical protein ACKO14_00385 [Armatimonadota bacterium]